jgi:hypothetical protein
MGSPQDIPAPSDYDGDGYVDFAVYRLNDWYILTSGNAGAYSVNWGYIPDVPLPADYDGDGLGDVAIYRPDNGVWYVRRSSSGTGLSVEWGVDGDIPVRPQP